jgi:hypothetical protein
MELRKKMELSFKDYLDFNYHFVRNRTIITPIAAIIILTVIISIMGIAQLGSGWASVFSNRLLVYYVILLLIPFVSLLTLRFAAKKQYESNKLMKSETEIVMNETGVSQSNKFGNTSVGWADLHKIEEVKNAFYIYIAKRQAFILPKRILENDEQAAARTLIAKYMAPNKYRFLKQR